jgi:hypothetical protein
MGQKTIPRQRGHRELNRRSQRERREKIRDGGMNLEIMKSGTIDRQRLVGHAAAMAFALSKEQKDFIGT